MRRRTCSPPCRATEPPDARPPPIGNRGGVWYPLPRRGVRVVDGAALEKRCAKAPRVRIPPSPPQPPTVRAGRRDAGRFRVSRRGRLVDYGAALEMRFAATRRGFESRPLRHFAHRGDADPCVGRSGPHSRTLECARSGPRGRLGLDARPSGEVLCRRAKPSGVDFSGRARRGTSGALYLQSAPAGLNPLPRSPSSNADASSDVEGRVPRSGDSRTVSGPEGSSTKRSSSGAAERPGPSRSLRWARGRPARRRVHGTLINSARPLAGAS
jgi:hypothetical protein